MLVEYNIFNVTGTLRLRTQILPKNKNVGDLRCKGCEKNSYCSTDLLERDGGCNRT